MLAQLPEDLVHLEGRRDGLDEHGRPDRPGRDPQVDLRRHEHVVPEARLEVVLESGRYRYGPLPRDRVSIRLTILYRSPAMTFSTAWTPTI